MKRFLAFLAACTLFVFTPLVAAASQAAGADIFAAVLLFAAVATVKGGYTLNAKGEPQDAYGRPVEAVEAKESPPGLAEHTVDELKEMAKAAGVEGYSAMRKAELIDAVSSAQ